MMHKQLTYTDRLKIESLLRDGKKPVVIAQIMRVHHTTIYRELKRGSYLHLNSDYTTETRYSPEIAQERHEYHQGSKGAPLKIGDDLALCQYIERKIIEDHYSPAAVLGEIKNLGLTFRTMICEKTIYNYIEKGVFLHLTNKDLPNKGNRKRKYKKIRPLRAPRGESIEKRPDEVSKRDTFGHWEMDCVVGKKGSRRCLLVLSERLTRMELIMPLAQQTMRSVVSSLNRLERKYKDRFPRIFRSITVDNGSEFSDCVGMEQSILYPGKQRTKVYYCHPYSAYERGTNENINRMIRRKYPKGTNFGRVTAASIKALETWINTYPREILGFKTAEMMFYQCISDF